MQAASGEAGAALVRKATKNDADALVRFNAAMARESEGVELPRRGCARGCSPSSRIPRADNIGFASATARSLGSAW